MFICFYSCSDGYLKLYLKGQEATDSYDKFDYELCGEESKPSHVVSDGPRLVMVFSSGELHGGGFKAKYTFETGKIQFDTSKITKVFLKQYVNLDM